MRPSGGGSGVGSSARLRGVIGVGGDVVSPIILPGYVVAGDDRMCVSPVLQVDATRGFELL